MVFLRDGSPLTNGSLQLYMPSTPPVAADLLLQTHGDSISRDLGYDNYIFVCGSLIVSGQELNPRLAERGINGISYDYHWGGEPYDATMMTDAPVAVDVNIDPGIPSYLTIFAGTNGIALGGHSVATEYADFKAYVAARVSAGWDPSLMVAVLMLPRTDLNYETVTTAFNDLIRGDDGGFGYRVARTDLQPVGMDGANLDPLLFYDGTHPTALGQSQIATAVYDAMFP